MKPIKALTLSLGDLGLPVITSYRLGRLVYFLYKEKRYKKESVPLQKKYADRSDFNKYKSELLREGVLNDDTRLPHSTYSLLGASNWEAEDAICIIDPFCYLSHLSAMEYHGLTDRIPAKIFVSSPSTTDWKRFAEERMKKDLQEDFMNYVSSGLPKLTQLKVNRIGKKTIHKFNSKHLGAYKNVRGRELRVSSIGRTFLDMLRSPDLCGGISHVLEVYEEHAPRYARLIVDEIDNNGKIIDKVRAGYILEERLGLEIDTVNSWKSLASRGGSRKLDPTAEYYSDFSDTWCISINI